MKRGDEGESHKVGNGRKSGMVKITIMKKEKGVEEDLGCLHGWASANVLELIIFAIAPSTWGVNRLPPRPTRTSCIISSKFPFQKSFILDPRPFG